MSNSTQFKLTDEETDRFLKVIQLERYVEGECRFRYLEQAMEKTQEYVPFQNLFLLSVPFKERREIDYDEVKEHMLNGTGGYCIVMNPFFCGFLQSLGYEAVVIHASCRGIPENHASIIVRNLIEQGDRYLVDVCLGYKNMPFKIDLEQKSEIISYSFCQYYYEWKDETKQVLNRFDIHSTFFCCFTFEEFKDYEDLISFQGAVYTDVKRSPYHHFFRMIRFPSSGAVILRENLHKEKQIQLLVENLITRKLEVKDEISDLDHFIKRVEEHFPMADIKQCSKALHNYFTEIVPKS